MSILLFFIVLLVLVIPHEFGHFIVAKLAGIRVDEFAFGFPPRLLKKRWGETTYVFNALPLGGYVKIYGEDPTDVRIEDRHRSFGAQPKVIQGAVIIAGIVTNILLAWLLISLAFMIGVSAPAGTEYGSAVSDPRLTISELAHDSPASSAGLLPGDVIVRVSDFGQSAVANAPEAVSGFVSTREGQSVTFTIERDGETMEIPVVPKLGIIDQGAAVGIYMDMVGTLRLPFLAALVEGASKTIEFTQLTAVGIYGFLADTIFGRGDFTQVTGPVGIVKAVGVAAGVGFTNLLLFVAIISINLAVINVLPLPALDGGRLLFIIIETIMRRPIAPRYANALNLFGFALLILLMIVVTYHDLVR